MALIDCPECGSEISDLATACIHCGCPIGYSGTDITPTPRPVAAAVETVRSRHEISDFWPTKPLSRGLSKTVEAFFWSTAGLYAVAAGLFGFYAYRWNEWTQRGPSSVLVRQMRDAEDAAFAFVPLPWLAFLITGVLFIIWFYQAYKSAESRGATGRRWGSGWTVGSWFIPIAMFVIPKLVMNEVDRMSSSSAGKPPIKARWIELSRLTASDYWWAAFVMGFLGLSVGLGWLETVGVFDPNYGWVLVLVVSGLVLMAVAGVAGAITVREIGVNLSESWIDVGSASRIDGYGLTDNPDGSGIQASIMGYEWTGQAEERVRCLTCARHVYFPSGQERHRTHRIARLIAEPSEYESPARPAGPNHPAEDADFESIGTKHRSLTPDDPVGAATRAHSERLTYAAQLHADGRYTEAQLTQFKAASKAEMDHDVAEARRTQ